MPTRILLLGPISPETLAALQTLPGGVTILGAGYGIGKIGSAAVESMARQPEAANKIQTAMIIAAALIEGVTLVALIVCIMSIGTGPYFEPK